MPNPTSKPMVTKITIDGLEIPVDMLPPVDDEAVAKIFKVIAAIDESEQSDFILSTSTAAYR
jgi:hypothetical protein